MILDYRFMKINDDDWIHLLKQYLNQWTEIPLSANEGYDIEELKFFDGFIGTIIRQTESRLIECPRSVNKEFVESWSYQGKLYRVIHQNHFQDKDGKWHCRLPHVKYHGMITHWTTDYTFEKLLYKLNRNTKYIILEADTKNHLGFDVNRFRKAHNCTSPYTEGENEVIFPMYKDCITEYRMTISEFVKMKNRQ